MTPNRRRKRIARWIAGLVAAWILIHIVYAAWDGLHDDGQKAEMAVVLGNAVKRDSSLSAVLQGRVDKALLLYQEGRVKKILLSGGEDKEDHLMPEGSAMRRYLLKKGIPDSDLVVDNAGQNTYLTAKNFMALNDSLHVSSVILVSSFYHITRCKYIFRRLGFHQVSGVSSDRFFWADFWGMGRDFLAFYKYVLIY